MGLCQATEESPETGGIGTVTITLLPLHLCGREGPQTRSQRDIKLWPVLTL